MFLGIDTSCYTTSVALVDEHGNLIDERRQLLAVKEGSRGLRQSDALFAHIKGGSELLSAFVRLHADKHIDAVCVSDRPRPLEDSYMPVFLAGLNDAKMISAALNVPLYTVSHQEGHLRAAEYGANVRFDKEFLAVHLSGGTSEILKVTPRCDGYDIELVGGTSDLPAGQLVDRIGVKMGLSFPAGRALDEMAQKATERDFIIGGPAKDEKFSLSGVESSAIRAVENGVANEKIAYAVFSAVGSGLAKALRFCADKYGIDRVLVAGGVAGSVTLRAALNKRLSGRVDLYFAPPQLSADNAVGVALLGNAKHSAVK